MYTHNASVARTHTHTHYSSQKRLNFLFFVVFWKRPWLWLWTFFTAATETERMSGKEKCVIEKHSKCKQLARQNICTRQEREYVRSVRLCVYSVRFCFRAKKFCWERYTNTCLFHLVCECHAGSIIFMHWCVVCTLRFSFRLSLCFCVNLKCFTCSKWTAFLNF